MKKLIVWDFNGTVLDDAALCVEIENTLRTQRNLPLIKMEDYLTHFDFPIIEYYKKTGVDFTEVSYDETARLYMEIYQPASLRAPLRRGVLDVIQTFKDKGLRQILLSASQKDNLLEQTEAFGITQLFDAVLGLDDIYGYSKVALAVNWFTQNRIPPESAVFIGDTTHDYAVAKAVGCDCVLLYGGHNSRERLEATGAAILPDVFGLPKYLGM